jgi:hypothetical protein
LRRIRLVVVTVTVFDAVALNVMVLVPSGSTATVPLYVPEFGSDADASSDAPAEEFPVTSII